MPSRPAGTARRKRCPSVFGAHRSAVLEDTLPGRRPAEQHPVEPRVASPIICRSALAIEAQPATSDP
ncbi:hypothetical protein [Verminephrobacter eiseniae]|uniref:hypothetical protein n=1 Tax=Verminephrobacter eiseniae TaxID=364317 RepID=UPI0022441CBE|nr:hypothetical protein [Verminephrobacter eiseniae]